MATDNPFISKKIINRVRIRVPFSSYTMKGLMSKGEWMKKRTDNEIIELYWNRDESAIRETETKYGNYCFAVANNILENREDAEECLSDTWLTAWNTIPPMRPKVLKLFLARITRRNAFDKYRHDTATKRGGGEITQSLDELADCLPAPSSVEMELSAQEMKTCINAFLVTLPERDADVFLRRYFYVESVPEIAKRYALKESNVLMVLSRTRKKLEQHLIKEGMIDDQRAII